MTTKILLALLAIPVFAVAGIQDDAHDDAKFFFDNVPATNEGAMEAYVAGCMHVRGYVTMKDQNEYAAGFSAELHYLLQTPRNEQQQ
jgi:hypothetical protein